MHTIDWTPLINIVLELAASVLLAAGTWAVARFVRWLGLQNAAQAADNLDDALQKALVYGIQQSEELIRQRGWDHIEVRNAVLAQALPYAIGRFPDALKDVGLDLTNRQVVQQVVQGALERAFPDAAQTASLSPATPPRTAPNPLSSSDLPAQQQLVATVVHSP